MTLDTAKEHCDICGFVWEDVAVGDVPDRLRSAADRVLAAVAAAGDTVGVRSSPATWSILEYAAHVRDVLYHVRDRVVIALVEENPDFKPLYRDQRVDLGLYAADDPAVVATELPLAVELFARTFSRLSAEQRSRPCRYAFPTVQQRSVLWMAQQVVHELEHHAGDVEALLGPPR